MYTLLFTAHFEKQLRKLPNDISQRIVSALERISIRPHSYIERLVGSPHYKLRVGDYHIILDIMDDKLIIILLEAGHRRRIYK